MNFKKNLGFIILAVLLVIPSILPLSGCGGSSFPYQGSISGDWSGQLTVLSRNIPVGGAMTVEIDSKGSVTGTVNGSKDMNPATFTAKVDENGNMTGTVSFTFGSTTFNSNWQGKLTASGNTLIMQGTWTSAHGSGTFTGDGSRSK